MLKFWKQILGFILIICIFVVSIPGSAATNETQVESAALVEAIEFRDEYTKAFRKTDGTYIAISTAEALHYQDNEGQWQDIDNTLVNKINKDGEEVVTNTAAGFNAELPATFSNDKQVKIQKDTYSISFKLQEDTKKSKGRIKNKSTVKLSQEAKSAAKNQLKLEKKTSKAEYRNVLDNTNIMYDIKPNGVKESIILKNTPKKAVRYTYEINAEGLTAKLLDDNSIEFYAKGMTSPEFVMPTPYMFDSAKEIAYSKAITVTLVDLGNDQYELTYSPGIEWLTSDERKYPVTIDPTVESGKLKTNIQDRHINSTGYEELLKIGLSNPAYIKFNSLPTLPYGTTVTKAYLNMYYHSGSRNLANAKTITSNWSEYSTINPTTEYTSLDSINPESLSKFDITSLACNWYTYGNNYGVALVHPQLFSDTFFHSSETTEVDEDGVLKIPFLEIEFTTISGIDTRYDMHTFNMGRAGTAYLNDFTGKLTLKRSDMNFNGNVMPVEIGMLDQSTFTYYRINYNSTFKYYTVTDINGVTYYLSKIEKGDQISDTNWKEVWSGDNDYKIYSTTSDTYLRNYNNIFLITPEKHKVEFDSDAVGIKITDGSNPAKPFISITRSNGAYYKVTSAVIDGGGRKYIYNYIGSGIDFRLNSIDYLGLGETVLSTVQYNYINGRLASVTYGDGESLTYANTSTGLSITDSDGYKLVFTYTTGLAPRIGKIEEFAADGTAGDWLTIEYSTYLTKFTDSRGQMEIKQFDRYGNTTCVRDENGCAVFSAPRKGSKSDQFSIRSQIQVPGENNLIQNWDFSNSKTAWTTNTPYNPIFPAVDLPPAIQNYIVPCYDGQKAYLKQRVLLNGKKDDAYSFGGWAKNDGGILQTNNSLINQRTFGMKIEIPNENASESILISSFDFNAYTHEWQYIKEAFTLPHDVSYIDLYFSSDYQFDYPRFTGAELQKQPLYYYAADQNGNIEENEGKAPEDETGIINIDYSKTRKDEYGRTVESISAAGVGQSYSYDDNGNIISSAVTNGRVKMETKNTYTANKNYLTSTTDPLGNTTTYDYNQNYGTLSSVTDANNKSTTYSYDSIQRLTGVFKNVTGLTGGSALINNYTYEYDRLKTITHNGFSYMFNYNKWGNLGSVQVGTQTLVSNTFTDNVAKLLDTVTFGNGQFHKYFYDNKDRLEKIRYEGDSSDRYTYTYNPIGELTDKKDFVTGTWTKYLKEKIEEWDIEGTVLQHSYVHDGDKFIEKIGDNTITYSYLSDNDGRPMSTSYAYTANRTAATETRYDDLGRVINQGVTAALSGSQQQIYWTNYLYRELPGFKSSEQVYAVDYTFGGQSSAFNHILSYSYDVLGNITAINKNNAAQQSYAYDAAGQLVRVNDTIQNKTVTYAYDIGGNIREKKEYAYTEGALGSVLDTIVYGYTDSNWKDKLTSYDGKPITYDAIGNPLAYDGMTFTWEGGRQLKSITKGGTTVGFTYNADGIRRKKIVDGVATVYTLVGNTISAQNTGQDWIYFRYDQSGSLISLNWQGDEYFYVLNTQGDVIGLVDESGTLVVEYEYDAWGKLTSSVEHEYTYDPVAEQWDLTNTINNPTSGIAVANPFRYRGYYYDVETGLYSLQSRYYDPETGRFINADDTDIMLEHLDDSILATNLYAYCLNNPVRYYDPYGEFATEAGILTYITYTSAAGASNFWNPVGLVLLGAAVVGVGIWAGVKIYNSQKAKQAAALSSALALMNFASTSATPPPPNKGGKGTRTSSKTLHTENGKNGFRIDVENPGNRAGQIHMQKGGVKYYYNVAEKSFRIGSSNGQLAPKAIQQLLQSSDVIKAIGKGLTILGY